MENLSQPQDDEPRTPPVGQVSELLRAWSDGNRAALDSLTPIVYDELHRLARHYMKGERPGHSLQTTALVNEAYMRLVDYKSMKWQNRAHFFAVSAQLMRRILVDHAAMSALAQLDPRKVQVVEMRFFGGLSVEETADVLKVSAVTVMRDWSTAKAWLYRELTRELRDG
jgi:RNA polymerase sigma-70 factor (ECF subfamily)